MAWKRSILLLLAFANPALASDGVLEINQTCAVETGCFAGDDPGLPVTISAPGSYRLTGNLEIPDTETHGIQVDAEAVGIDLNGFAISGPVVCSGSPVDCSAGSGWGSGVNGGDGVAVRNGTIRGMGRYGVHLEDRAVVEGLQIHSNRSTGVLAGGGSILSSNTVHQNGAVGINSGRATSITGNTTYGNGWTGIFANPGSTVSGNTSYGNGGPGIGGNGGNTILGNTSYGNGNGSINGHGITCGSGCIVRDNAVRDNSGYGLFLQDTAAYGANVIVGNTRGTVNGGLNILLNVCDGASAPQCP